MIIMMELHRFTRFSLSGIETFTYNPKAKIQLITGTNGVGKSSLLQEATPLPADLNHDYLEGGYKYIKYLHNNEYYELTSGVNGTKKHSFKIEGVEKNDGGTKKVQLFLVKEHFKVTPMIHTVLTGIDKFTDMSKLDRKDWFTLMSSNDYTYVLDLFKRLSIENRDLNGGIKLLNNRLVTLEKDLVSPEQSEQLIIRRNSLEQTLTDILKNYNKVEPIVDNSKTLLALNKIIVNYEKLDDLTLTKNDLIRIVTKMGIVKTTIEEIEGTLEELHLKKPVTYIEERKEELLKLTKGISVNETNPLDIGTQELCSFMDHKGTLDELFIELDENIQITDKEPLNQQLGQHLSSLDISKDRLNKVSGKIEEYNDIVKDGKVICPSCNHTWVDKYDESSHSSALREKTSLNQQVLKYEETIVTIEKKLTEINLQIKIHDQIKMILSSPVGTTVTTWSKEKRLSLPIVLNLIAIGLPSWQKTDETLAYIKEIKHEIAILEQSSISNLNRTISMTTLKLEDTVKEYYNLTKEKEIVKTKLRYLEKIENYKETISVNLKQYGKYLKVKEELKINEIKDSLILDIEREISRITSLLNENEIINSKVAEVEEQMTTYKQKGVEINKILNALSPKGGLIALNISSTLGGVIEEINQFIKNIWSYDMKIFPPEIGDGNDLVYSFPIKINSISDRKDVSNGSTGMKEIIDLAFKLTAINKLQLQSQPLILDEFGGSLTEQHREATYSSLSQVFTQFQQVFIVSHFYSIHGRFNAVDVIDLSGSSTDIYQIKRYK